MSDVAIARSALEAARRVAGVVDPAPGRASMVATLGPGERVDDVALRPAEEIRAFDIELHLVARYSEALDLRELAGRVREAVRRELENLPGGLSIRFIHVTFGDLWVGEGHEGEVGA